jgi:hypothetical protein
VTRDIRIAAKTKPRIKRGISPILVGGIVALSLVVIGGLTFVAVKTQQAALDPTHAAVIMGQATATAQALQITALAQQYHEYLLTGTALALTPNATPTVASTPTAVSTTASGLVVYDNFNDETAIDPARWEQSPAYSIENGALAFRGVKGSVVTGYHDISPTREWTPASSGQVRFDAEIRMMVDSTIRPTFQRVSPSLQITGPGEWWFSLGYSYSGGLQYECNFNHGSNNAPFYILDTGSTNFDKWHTFRLAVEEINGSTDLSMNAYVDGIRICTATPPASWQVLVGRSERVSLLLVSWWSGAWDLDTPLLIHYDDVAIGPVSVR